MAKDSSSSIARYYVGYNKRSLWRIEYLAVAMVNSIIEDFQNSLGNKAQCTDDIKSGVKLLPKVYALKKKYISLNQRLCFYIWLDIDNFKNSDAVQWDSIEERIVDENLPKPTLIIKNKENNRGHVAWRLDRPVCMTEKGHKAPQDYLRSIKKAFSIRMGADLNFTGVHVKNPCSTHFRVTTNDVSYSLEDLMHVMDHEDTFFVTSKKEMNRRKAANESIIKEGVSRNCDLFNMTRHWAYAEVGLYSDYISWEQACLSFTVKHNTSAEKLPYKEERSIARSVAKWTWQNRAVLKSKSFSKPKLDPAEVKKRQGLSGQKTKQKRTASTLNTLEEAVAKLISMGKVVTKRGVQLFSAVSYRTVERYWNRLQDSIKQIRKKAVKTPETNAIQPRKTKHPENTPKANRTNIFNTTNGVCYQVYRHYSAPIKIDDPKNNIISPKSPPNKQSTPVKPRPKTTISPGELKYLSITIRHLQAEEGVCISDPDQFLSECVFSLVHAEQFKGLKSFKHKVNIMAKLVRSNRWRTPIGFYHHSIDGKRYKLKQERKEKEWQQQKQVEGRCANDIVHHLRSTLSFGEQTQYDDKTQKALALVESIKRLKEKLSQSMKNNTDLLQSLIEKHINQIQQLILHGADSSVISKALS